MTSRGHDTVREPDTLVVRYRPIVRLLDGAMIAVEAVPSRSNTRLENFKHSRWWSSLSGGNRQLMADLRVVDRAVPNLGAVISLLSVDSWLGVPVSTNSVKDPRFTSGVFEILDRWGATPDGLALCLDRSPVTRDECRAIRSLQDQGVWFVAPQQRPALLASDALNSTTQDTAHHTARSAPVDEDWDVFEPDVVTIEATAAFAGDDGDPHESQVQASDRWHHVRRRVDTLVRGLDSPEAVHLAERAGFGYGAGSAIGSPIALARLFWPDSLGSGERIN